MKPIIIALALALFAGSIDAQAGGGGRGGAPPSVSPPPPGGVQGRGGRGGRAGAAPGSSPVQYSQYLYAPEVVMRYQQGITLQDAQRTRIIAEMSQAQAKFTEIQWTMSGEEEKLERLLQEPAPGEQAVIAQMDRILSLEQNLKRTQMVLLVRVKNILTPEQQATLSRLQRGGPATPGAPGRGGRGGGTGGSVPQRSSGSR